jgi:hypothetical protein
MKLRIVLGDLGPSSTRYLYSQDFEREANVTISECEEMKEKNVSTWKIQYL